MCFSKPLLHLLFIVSLFLKVSSNLVKSPQGDHVSRNHHNHDHRNCKKTELADSIPSLVLSPLPSSYLLPSDLPDRWDWRNINGVNYITRNLNQHIPHYCGSCWLHASIATLNDRLKIAKKAQWPEVTLARQVLLNCGEGLAGSCEGGSDFGTYVFAHRYGIPDDSCQLYSARDYECTHFRNCMNCDPQSSLLETDSSSLCYPVQRYDRYFATEYGKMKKPTVFEMKAEIYKRGPISCGMDASELEYGKYIKGDIVNKTIDEMKEKEFNMDHDVSIVGWSTDKRDEFWIVRNSWGSFWGGDNGFFKVKTGVNAMGIETECNWAVMKPEPTTRDWGPADNTRIFASTSIPPSSDHHDLISVIPEHYRNKQNGIHSVVDTNHSTKRDLASPEGEHVGYFNLFLFPL